MKDIPGHEGRYAITRDGKIWSHISGRYLSVYKDVAGYMATRIGPLNASRTYRICQLIGRTYLPNPRHLREINHKNGNKLDDSIGNLEWCTHLHNMRHAWRTGLVNLHGERSPNAKLNTEQVLEIRRLYKTGNIYQRDLAKRYNVGQQQISKVVNAQRWQHVA